MMILCESLGRDAYIGALVTIISVWVGVFTLVITLIPFLTKNRLKDVNSKFDEVNHELNSIKKLSKDVDEKIANLNQQTASVQKKFADISNKIEELDNRTKGLKSQADAVENILSKAPVVHPQ